MSDRGTIKIRGRIKGSFTIRGRINGSFTIRGRRTKHAIKRSFTCHDLSQDLITDILSRLSVKVLLRFKCVCKRWHDLIESSEFVSLHYDKMSTKRKSLIFSCPNSFAVSTFSSDNLEVSKYVDCPFIEDKTIIRGPIRISGPCNGVWLLSGMEYSSSDRESSRGSRREHNDYIDFDCVGFTIALWNPATRELKALPKCCARDYVRDGSIKYPLQVNFGFGYNKNTNDYKVVKISKSRVQVYSLRNDRWREIEAIVPISMRYVPDSSSTSLKGIHYWLSDNVILSFNLRNEVFETIELPMPHGNLETMRKAKLLVLHDCLALVRPYGYYYERSFEVLKLKKNNGGVNSWTKVSIIRPPSDFMPDEFLGFSEDSNAVIKDFGGRLMLHDLETHGTKFIRNNDYIMMMRFYVESLGSVRGGGRLRTPSSFRKLACYDDSFSLGYHEIFSPL